MGQTHPTSQPATTSEPGDHLSVTEHSIQLNGQPLTYRATAGTIQLKTETDKPRANFSFVAYEKLPTTRPSARPITYVFNGGPGAAAVWLHLGAAGPKRVVTNDDGTLPAPPYKLADNQATWLDATDLVFIDPVGTGYSRAAEDQKPSEFFGLHEDVASVADFIRLYATRYGRWTSPTFVAGESYGTTRGTALSQYLLDRYGMALNGLVLISSVLNFETIDATPGNDLAYALHLPSYALIALYHGKLKATDFLGPDGKPMSREQIIQNVRQFAIHEYLPLLAEGNLSPQQQRELADKLAHFTGLSTDLIQRANDRIDPGLFEKNLLADEHKVLGQFDARLTGFDLNATSNYPEIDPSFSSFFAAYSATFNEYVRHDLQFKSDLPYEVLTGKVMPWNFQNPGTTGYLDVSGDLRGALAKNPHMKVLFVSGYYDLATPFMTADYTIDHLNLSPELRANIQHVYFDSGHMVYQVPAAAQQLEADIAKFISSATVAN
jgi:carboxypeptidase C (cathepsin A)